eukprot:m.94688 g.94688  ORF g.94688 m.94688 type:complete len:191 (-) comp8722_c0_seq2:956-1528(-)
MHCWAQIGCASSGIGGCVQCQSVQLASCCVCRRGTCRAIEGHGARRERKIATAMATDGWATPELTMLACALLPPIVSFGTVVLAQDAAGREFAVKKIERPQPGSLPAQMLSSEMTILKRVSHPNIIWLEEILEAPDMIYLVFEYCAAGDLEDLVCCGAVGGARRVLNKWCSRSMFEAMDLSATMTGSVPA